jgi:serine/threonine protein kinase/Tfp pilus assembly protein PilF
MLPERYTYIRTLGEGTWGDVSLARDTTTGREVAVKSINVDDAIDQAMLDKEIATLTELDHPHIVRFLDMSVDHGHIHIVTEYIEGKTLEEVIEGGILPFDRLKRYADQMLDALSHVHDRGIIHSDLKPANVIIDAGGNCHLIDFGIVRTASAEIAADIKEIRGTLHYMSPEQAEGNPYDVRSDLFSFGVMLYEMCTGKKPFDGEYDMAVVYAIMYEDPVPPHKVNPKLPEALSGAILDLLAKKPVDRPATARVVRERIKDISEEVAPAEAANGNRVAILPFDFPADDNDSQVIAEGVRDELYARLKGIDGLDLVSPIKIRQVANKMTDGAAVRAMVGADSYVTGRIRKSSSQIRFYFMHLNSCDDSIIAQEKYDAPLSDLFDLIDQIAEKVVPALRTTLTGKAPEVKSSATTPVRPEAYEMYLVARNYYVKNSRKEIDYAQHAFEEALKFDPNYALAYVGLADCFSTKYMNYFDRRPETIRQAEDYARKALEITTDLPEGYRALGRILQVVGKVKEAAANYLKAVTYREDYYQAYRSLAWLAKDCFRYDEAQGWIRKALSINASDMETIYLSGVIHYEKKESKLAVNDFTRTLELRPDFGRALFYRALTYHQIGRLDSAIEDLERAVQLGGDINAPYILGSYHIAKGDYRHALEILNNVAEPDDLAFIVHHYCGVAHLLSEEVDKARSCFGQSAALCRELLSQYPDMNVAKSILAGNLAFLGVEEECRQLLSELSNYTVNDGGTAHDIARSYAILGDIKTAREYINRALETYQGPTEIEISLDPILKRYLG